MAAYPVQLEVTPALGYDRVQLLVRIGVAIVLGWLGITAGSASILLYLVLPLFAAIMLSTRSADVYLADTTPRLGRILDWLMALSAYMLLVTDRFPADRDHGVRVQLEPSARPTVGSALLRLISSIPSAIVLAILWFVSSILVFVSFVTVLVTRSIPAFIVEFQLGILRWQARLLAYHASVVDEYPPFSLDTSRTETSAHARVI